MNSSGNKFLLLIVIILVSQIAKGDKLEDGFERLKMFDYFKAKEYFEKSLEKRTPGAAYGLTMIFVNEKNPFFNLDSARKYILLSDSTFKTIKQKEKKYYAEFGVTDSSIENLSATVCEKYFIYVQSVDSLEIYNHYLSDFSNCVDKDNVVELRNAAAFRITSRENTSEAYLRYSQVYPDAEDSQRAIELYQQRLFEEKTTDNQIPSFESFMSNYPTSPYKEEADRMIYKLSTSHKSVREYAAFARKYPNSKYSDDAWRQVYALAMKDFSESSFNTFKSNYPDYPFMGEMESDYKIQNYTFLPIEKNEKWGYINENGNELIAPQYDDANLFSEGLATVTVKNKSGYIGKSGKTILPLIFKEAESFHNGNAIVMFDSLYGLINRKGEFVINPEYEELSDGAENIYIGVKNGKSGYINKVGKPITRFDFDVATDFNDGLAIVSVNNKYGIVNSVGKFVIEPLYDELINIGKGLLKASNNDKWGVIDLKGNNVTSFIYDAIGEYKDGLSLVAANGKYGFINAAGEERIPVKYQYVPSLLNTGNFFKGHVILHLKNKLLLADTTGTIVSFPGVEQYGLPSEGLIPVMKNKKWGFSDLNGKLKIQPKFDNVESFKNGFSVVKSKGLYGVIDTTGSFVIQPIYDNVIPKDEYFVVIKEGKSGALSKNSSLILPCAYKSIDMIGNKILRGRNEIRLIYVELNGRIIYVGDRD